MEKRENYLDIARGLLIIFVVMGHLSINPLLKDVIYWFHMPAFFIIGGLLFKSHEGKNFTF